MSIIDYFISSRQRSNRGQLASVVRILKSNGKLTRDEIRFLKKIKTELEINSLAYRKIVRNPDLYPVNPPTSYEQRIKMLYYLAKVLWVDKESYDLSFRVLEKLALELGFPIKIYKEIVRVAVDLTKQDIDLETFEEEIRKVKEVAGE